MRRLVLLVPAMVLAGGGALRADDALMAEAQALAGRNIPYGAAVAVEGDDGKWAMDCSNAARYLVSRTKGVELPRTASDQYLYVREHGRLRRVGGLFGGIPDERWWARRMKPGDLIFWEHTYKPQRKPPVTHVMVYLGRGPNGDLLMAGAQNSRGVDIYEFRPRVPYGGHGGFLGLFKKKGRVVAFGRLADPRG